MPFQLPEVGDVIVEAAQRYRLLRLIGEGGMGAVYEARDERLGDAGRFAIKILRPPAMMDGERVTRLCEREARLGTHVRSVHAVCILGIGVDRSRGWPIHFLRMELLDGQNLAERIEQRGALQLSQALQILLPVMQVVERLHEAQVVHRDLKPGNVFLARIDEASGSREIPKLLDFGIAYSLDPRSTASFGLGQLCGTPPYMSLGQLQGRLPEPAFDVHALGVMLYQVLSGELPFQGDTLEELVRAHESGPKPQPQLEPSLWSIICRAISQSVPGRFHHVTELREALLSLVADVHGARHVPPRALARHRLFAGLAAAACLSLVATLQSSRPSRTATSATIPAPRQAHTTRAPSVHVAPKATRDPLIPPAKDERAPMGSYSQSSASLLLPLDAGVARIRVRDSRIGKRNQPMSPTPKSSPAAELDWRQGATGPISRERGTRQRGDR